MANFNQRGANIAQFMREGHLNTISMGEPQEDYSALDAPENLDVFMTQDFFDFDEGVRKDFKPSDDAAPSTKPAPGEPASATSMVGDFPSLNFTSMGSGRSWFFLISTSVPCFAPPRFQNTKWLPQVARSTARYGCQVQLHRTASVLDYSSCCGEAADFESSTHGLLL